MASRRRDRRARFERVRSLLRAGLDAAGHRLRAPGVLPALISVGVMLLGIAAGAPMIESRQAQHKPAPAPMALKIETVPVALPEPAAEHVAEPGSGPESGPGAPKTSTDAEPGVPGPTPTTGPAPPERDWRLVRVRSGDTMEIIFRRLGLSPRLLHEVVHLNDHTATLVELMPGDEIAFDLADDGAFRALRAEFDDDSWLFVEQADDGLASRLKARNLDVRIAEVEAEITSSLFDAGKRAGLSDNMILRLAGIFGWDIDFALDIRRGDRFALVFEEIYRDGEFLRQGPILAARFINQGESFEAVRFDAGNGPDFYDPQGRPMRKQFLRAPINFTRVSSNFNPRRLHPVTRRVRPHNGTDYAAPTGTPVWAAGDGTVIEAGYTRANGNYIFLKHGNHIVTRYLHLSRKLVSRGDRVRQGQTIGRVGATGLATGPHLHYEFLVHGRHRDPRRVDLPEADPLPADLLPEFRAHARPWFARLGDLLPPDVLLANTDGQSPPPSGETGSETTSPRPAAME